MRYTTFPVSFRLNRKDKKMLAGIARRLDASMSETVRLLIRTTDQFMRDEKKKNTQDAQNIKIIED